MEHDRSWPIFTAVTVIDRRLAGKNKSVGNRERFLQRHKVDIREAVDKAIGKKSIRDVDLGIDVPVKRKDIKEPVFGHAQGGGRRWIVNPGNEEYATGDHITRPPGGGSGSGQGASDSGEGEDEFTFALSKEEFLNVFFEDMELPNVVLNQLAISPNWKSVRAGFTSSGTPNNLSIVRTFRGAYGREIAFGKSDLEEELEALEQLLLRLEPFRHTDPAYDVERARVEREIARLRASVDEIPYLDPLDLKFRNRTRVPVPVFKAVMFCLMDVSGSMDEDRKDLSKRFFILLYLFLTRHYEKIEVVFIRHHTRAEEVDEEKFFYGNETGGTVVSSALVLMEKIIKERYPSDEWNIYGAQASDGDNYQSDSEGCKSLLIEQILPLVRYYAYIQVAEEEQNLWDVFCEVDSVSPRFAMRKVLERGDIFPVFHDLFKKEGQHHE